MKKTTKKELKKLISRDYPYVLYREKETKYYIMKFPDLLNCYVQGESLNEVFKWKDRVVRDFLKGLYGIFRQLPEPSKTENQRQC